MLSRDPVPVCYGEWENKYLLHVVPASAPPGLYVPYDVQANPGRFFLPSIFMNAIHEEKGHRLFQPCSLRASYIPSHVRLDTVTLIMLFALSGEKSEFLKNVNANKVTLRCLSHDFVFV